MKTKNDYGMRSVGSAQRGETREALKGEILQKISPTEAGLKVFTFGNIALL
jgi:hypothetical protein